jgi:hypothetical protein
MAIMLWAIATGQKLGNAKMMTAPTAMMALQQGPQSASTITPRLKRVSSIAAPIGVCAASASRPPSEVTSPTSDWLQCCWVTRKTLR